jgi:hypothetical protein
MEHVDETKLRSVANWNRYSKEGPSKKPLLSSKTSAPHKAVERNSAIVKSKAINPSSSSGPQRVDVLLFDEIVSEAFKSEVANLDNFLDEIDAMSKVLELDTLTPNMRRKLATDKTSLEKLSLDIQSGFTRSFYLSDSGKLIDEYKVLLNRPIEVSFTGKKKLVDTKDLDIILSRYTMLVKKYSLLERIPKLRGYVIDRVANCSTIYSRSFDRVQCECGSVEFDVVDESHHTCVCCGMEQDKLTYTPTYIDTGRINMTTKYKYERKTHIRDSMNQYQGIQTNSVSKKVLDGLYHQFGLNGLLAEGKSLHEQCRNITRRHIYLFLKENECSSHYADTQLIHTHFTGIAGPDISHLENAILADVEILSTLYDKLFIETKRILRKSFINAPYILYQLLRRHKHPCKTGDFSILKSSSCIDFHDETCGEMFAELGWNLYPVY